MSAVVLCQLYPSNIILSLEGDKPFYPSNILIVADCILKIPPKSARISEVRGKTRKTPESRRETANSLTIVQFYALVVASYCVAGLGEKSRRAAVNYAEKRKSGQFLKPNDASPITLFFSSMM